MSSRLARSATWYLLANLGGSAIPFLALPVLTRLLTPEQFGIAALFQAITAVMVALVGLSAPGALNVFYHQRAPEAFPRFVGSALTLVWTSALVLTVLTWLGAALWPGETWLPPEWLALCVVLAALQMVAQVRLAAWQTAGQARPYAAFQLSQAAGNVLLSLGLIATVLPDWHGRATGLVLAALVAAAVALWTLARKQQLRWGADGASLRELLRFGVPLLPHALGGVALANADRFVIAGALDEHAVGLYIAGLQLGMIVQLLADAVNKAYAPWLFGVLARNDAATLRRVVRATYGYFAAITVFALLLGWLAPPLAALVLGPRYAGAEQVVLFIALGGAFHGMYLMVTNYLFYAKKTAVLSRITLSCAVLSVLLALALVHAIGLVGAALAFALSKACFFAATWFFAARHHPMPWRSAFGAVA
ncbi:lipopolysaccharide biosynthesis protein [Chitinolyticbacter meiyuanensis]|uniref:lipopolysaccharide biosynthesis protein n=1 Tax=Chitinolyticbacter meiyuanensis TaxID=682798 RepID=UPI0011E5F980|nr:oligosaccharide flippase family protein [Chitinolyticbacter meiyuanensis]